MDITEQVEMLIRNVILITHYAFEQDQVLLESCLQTCLTYTIAKGTVNEFLMMDKGTVRNM